jgi:hypothetical protein
MYAEGEALVANLSLRAIHPKARAKVSNDLFLLPGTDNRSVAARRYRDTIRAALADMGKPDAELTESEREQLRTLGLLTVRLDVMQERALSEAADNEVELGIVRLANTISRQRWQLGIGRRRRGDLGPADPLPYAGTKRRSKRKRGAAPDHLSRYLAAKGVSG